MIKRNEVMAAYRVLRPSDDENAVKVRAQVNSLRGVRLQEDGSVPYGGFGAVGHHSLRGVQQLFRFGQKPHCPLNVRILLVIDFFAFLEIVGRDIDLAYQETADKVGVCDEVNLREGDLLAQQELAEILHDFVGRFPARRQVRMLQSVFLSVGGEGSVGPEQGDLEVVESLIF